MIARARQAPLFRKLIVDLFAGAGGASTGVEEAFMRAGVERYVDVAINHWADAIACHERNHPMTEHHQASVWEIDPESISKPGGVGLLWASPDCTDFSKAKGGKPIRNEMRRSLAWVVVRWAFAVRPDVIMLENVEEFERWGPLDAAGLPIRDGSCFGAFTDSLRHLGYEVDWRQLRACDYGTPTTRKRLFIVARCDGKPIQWPEVTHGVHADVWESGVEGSRPHRNHRSRSLETDEANPKSRASHHRSEALAGALPKPETGGACGRLGHRKDGLPKLIPYRTAAECIDWSIPMCSIFATPDEAAQWAADHGLPRPRRPLAENTMRRIAAGIDRHVLQAARPFIVSVQHGESSGKRDYPIDEPLGVVTGRHEHAVVAPVMTECANASRPRSWRADEPMRTQLAYPKGGHHALIAPSLVQVGYGEREGQAPRVLDIEQPLGTVVGSASKHGLVAAFLSKHYGGVVGQPIDRPIGTVTGVDHHSVAACHITKLKGTNLCGRPCDEPIDTVQAHGNHYGLVSAFLAKFYGNDEFGQAIDRPMDAVTGTDRFGLVTIEIDGQTYAIADIAMRMLYPHELARAQGFRDDYVIDEGADGRKLSKRVQVQLIGNSVCRHVARALVTSNVVQQCDWLEVAA